MRDYPGDLFPSAVEYPFAPLPHLHEHVIIDRTAPSAVRVFGKSMFGVAAGWLLAIGWLWSRHVLAPDGGAFLPALIMIAVGGVFAWSLGRAPYAALERREWGHAAWWSAIPNAMLWATAWVILQQTA